MPDPSLTGESWSYRAPPTRHSVPYEGHSQSYGPDTGSRAPAATASITVPTIQLHGGPQQYHQPATAAGDGQTSSNVTLGRTANTRIIQRHRRCPALPYPFGNGSRRRRTPSLLLSCLHRRDQALDISSEVMSISEGVHQILFIPWNGRERTTFGVEESHYEYVWAHGASPAGLLGILSEDQVRPSAQDLKVEGTEMIQATAVCGSCAPEPWSHYCLQTVLAQAIKRPKAHTHGMVLCGAILSKHQHYKCDFRDTRKEHAIVARRGVVRTPERWPHEHRRAGDETCTECMTCIHVIELSYKRSADMSIHPMQGRCKVT